MRWMISTLLTLLFLVKHKMSHMLTLIIVTTLLLLFGQRSTLSHRNERQIEVLILLLWIHKTRHRMVQYYTRILLCLYLLFSLWLALSHHRIPYCTFWIMFSTFTKMLRNLSRHLVWVLGVSCEFTWCWGVEGFAFVILKIRNIWHKRWLFDCLTVPLFDICKTCERRLEFRFQGTRFVNLQIRLIRWM